MFSYFKFKFSNDWYSYEYVPMNMSDVKKSGLGPAQVNMVINDVIFSLIIFSK